MKLCLAAMNSKSYVKNLCESKYTLESFYYIKPWEIELIKKAKLFLLDSGAFTFLNSTKANVEMETYIQNYTNFINRYDVKYFFELDLDSIIGLNQVENIRYRLEKETGKKPIPVWHKSRGLQYWVDMCTEFDYVAIGGIVTKEIGKSDYEAFSIMNKIAQKNSTKVHGLGFTVKNVESYGFYSVDSSSWVSGSRYGAFYHFDGKNMINIRPTGRRAKDFKKIDQYNFDEWLKYQRYLEHKGSI